MKSSKEKARLLLAFAGMALALVGVGILITLLLPEGQARWTLVAIMCLSVAINSGVLFVPKILKSWKSRKELNAKLAKTHEAMTGPGGRGSR